MTAERAARVGAGSDVGAGRLGWRIYGLGVIALALMALTIGDFLPGESAPKDLPERTALAYAAGAFLLAGGIALEWRRFAAWAAVALTAYFGVVVVLLMDARLIVRHPGLYLAYSNLAEQLALAAGGLVIYAQFARLDPARAALLTRVGQAAFGACAVVFGGAHFLYMNLTAPLVPKWLPPSGEFWGYATGVFHILGGLALVVGVRARLAAILLAVMYGAFTPLVHLPIVLANPTKPYPWTELALNVLLTGCAWAMADSLARKT